MRMNSHLQPLSRIINRGTHSQFVELSFPISFRYNIVQWKGTHSEVRAVQQKFDTRKFLERWKERKDKDEWLFAIAVVKAGLEREGHLDATASEEIAQALRQFDISEEELEDYLQNNRDKLLRFLDSSPPPS